MVARVVTAPENCTAGNKNIGSGVGYPGNIIDLYPAVHLKLSLQSALVEHCPQRLYLGNSTLR